MFARDWGFSVGNWLWRLSGPFVFPIYGKYFNPHPSTFPFFLNNLGFPESKAMLGCSGFNTDKLMRQATGSAWASTASIVPCAGEIKAERQFARRDTTMLWS